jgi:RHS repeat-associated protein
MDTKRKLLKAAILTTVVLMCLSISPIESGLAAGGGSKRICSFLGDDPKPSILDQDIFEFNGTKGEKISITLEVDSSGTHTGKKANLSLMDWTTRTWFFRTTTGILPRTITATLPATGKYLILVVELPGLPKLESFRGDYCLTLASSGGGYATLARTSWVEPTENNTPVANAGPDQTVYVGDTVTLDGSKSSDVDGDPLTFRWSFTSTPSGSVAMLSDPTATNPTFVVDLSGNYVVQLIVNDGMIDSTPKTVTITTANSRPVAGAGPDQTVFVGDKVQLDGSASRDADKDPLSFFWSIISKPDQSTTALNSSSEIKPTFVPDLSGLYVVQLIVNDGKVDSDPDTTSITAKLRMFNVPNVVGMTQAAAQAAIIGAKLTVGTITQANSATVLAGSVISQSPVAGTSVAEGSSVSLVISSGPVMIIVRNVVGLTQAAAQAAIQAAGLQVGTVTTANSPTVPAASVISQNPPAGNSVPEGSLVDLAISLGPVMVTVPSVVGMTQDAAQSAIIGAQLAVGTITSGYHDTIPPGSVITQDPAGGSSAALGSSVNLVVSLGPSYIPPDPVTMAPPLDPTVVTSLSDATSFLYSGSNPIQTGVAPGTIDSKRAAVLKGRVLDRNDNPLYGVTISILNHPEFGQTLSRMDGMFDLAVNGGGLLTVNYNLQGYLNAQRQVQAPWDDYAWLPDVVLINSDPQVTVINFSEPIQVARGSVITDNDGTRQATLLFSQGTTAQMVLPNGNTQPISSLSVRVTEYSVGPNGPKAMPAELPAGTGYTYCVEFTADEALAAGATSVVFSQPVYHYVENFLNFPVGGIVPVGYYERQKGQWIASKNGRIIKILGITDGRADLDINGDGLADGSTSIAAFGITDAERTQLASLYTAGTSLWRVPIPHFTPWDCNWPYGFPSDAIEPPDPNPTIRNPDGPCPIYGSTVGCQNQVLGEAVTITGTPFRLHYQSDRVQGRKDADTLEIPLVGDSYPGSLQMIHLTINVAGKKPIKYDSGPRKNLTYTFTWDKKDGYNRPIDCSVPISWTINYEYQAVYQTPAQREQSFGILVYAAPIEVPPRSAIKASREYRGKVGACTSESQGLGSWTLNAHHIYDPMGRVVYFGDGRKMSVENIARTVKTVAGESCSASTPIGDGGPATVAKLCTPSGLAVGPDGSFYIADYGNWLVRRVGTDGIITTVAGTTSNVDGGDGGPATEAVIHGPRGVAVDADGNIYIAERDYSTIRRVRPDGIITTVAGTKDHAVCGTGNVGDGGPATSATFGNILGMALGPHESFYVSSDYEHVRIVQPALVGAQPGDIYIPSEDSSEIYLFNSEGRHQRTLDALTGLMRYQFTYGNSGKLISVEDSYNNVTTIERDPNDNDNPTAIVGPFGQRTTLGLDTNGYLKSISNPAGKAYSFLYSNDGLLLQTTYPRGNGSTFGYDSLGRLNHHADLAGNGQTITRSSLPNGYEVAITTALGVKTKYRVERLSTGDQQLTNTYPNGKQIVSVIGVDGSQKITRPDGTVTTVVKGPDPRFGMLAPIVKTATIKTPSGLTYVIKEDRTATLSDPINLLSLSGLTETISINDRVYTSTYQASTKKITSVSPQGRQVVTTLDSKGRIIERQVGGFYPTTFTYDDRGRVITIAQGTGVDARVQSITYDGEGNPLNFTDPISRNFGFGYDRNGRITLRSMPDGIEIRYAYDGNGNLIKITPPGRDDHDFSYTTEDLIQTYTPPSLGIGEGNMTANYNLDRQLTHIIRPEGAITDIGYDQEGRLASLTVSGENLTYIYDTDTGNLTSIAKQDGVLSLSYDGTLFTTEMYWGDGFASIQRVYDNNFNIISRAITGQHITDFHYDNDSLLIQAGDLAIVRDAQNGLVKSTTLGNVTDTRAHNLFGELQSYTALYNGAPLLNVQYSRDKLGRIIQKTETIGGTSTGVYDYSYDPRSRLSQVTLNQTPVATYSYDDNGNRLTGTYGGNTVIGTYDLQDRLIQYGNTIYTHTANGELQSKTSGSETTQFSYDGLGNLTGVTLSNGTKIEYKIDGAYRRIGKKVNGTLVKSYLYKDSLKPVAEASIGANGDYNVTSLFVYGTRPNTPDYMVTQGGTYRIISDQLGSPRLIVDIATGWVAQRMDYDEFGNVLLDTNPGFQPFGFAGGLYDPDTTLLHFGLRNYDPEIGRWITKDPALFTGGDTNLYAYVSNDPVNFIDPDGQYGNWNKDWDINPPPGTREKFVDEFGNFGEIYIDEKGRSIGTFCETGSCQRDINDLPKNVGYQGSNDLMCEGNWNCGDLNQRSLQQLDQFMDERIKLSLSAQPSPPPGPRGGDSGRVTGVPGVGPDTIEPHIRVLIGNVTIYNPCP